MLSGALLFDVRDCSAIRKDGDGIACELENIGVAIMGGEERAEEFGGWCIDNTKANMKGLQILRETRPEWIGLGCVAHGAHSAMKDFAPSRNWEAGSVSRLFARGCSTAGESST
jgi:hypothetical protein